MPEHPTDAHFSFTFVFKQALSITALKTEGKGFIKVEIEIMQK